jgi:hypothetical protein
MGIHDSFVGHWIKLFFTPTSNNPDRLLMPRTMTGYCHEAGDDDYIHFHNAGIEELKMYVARSLLNHVEIIAAPVPAPA